MPGEMVCHYALVLWAGVRA